ncbi:hypothetical protein Tco_0626199 [Tanacetum coccineum]|uniref:Uncharacterized protein n=1 Tax=Tanacetum coccineum TaxID=301880 RepID=A0ABQ4WJ23_9ASTR
MSSASSVVTYTSVYTDFEPGRVFWGADDEEITHGGIPRVIVYGYDRLPMQTVAPPSPDYIPGPEDPQTPPVPQDEDEREAMFIQPHVLDYVPKPIYPEYIPLEDEHVFPVKEQPLPPVDSPTVESPGYVTKSDPEEDLEEYEDDETEDGPVDYPMDVGDDGDDDDGDSSRDDADDEDKDEEEEHLAPVDSAVVVPTASISLPPEAEVDEGLIALTTHHPSPSYSHYNQPSTSRAPWIGARPHIVVYITSLVPILLIPSLGVLTNKSRTLRIASYSGPDRGCLLRITIPPLLHTNTSSTQDSIHTPPGMRSGRVLLLDLSEVESIVYGFCRAFLWILKQRPDPGISEVRYGIRDTWVDSAKAVLEIAPMTLGEVNTRVTELAELHEHDTQDYLAFFYLRSAPGGIVEEEAYASREAWAHAIGLSQAVHFELQTHRRVVSNIYKGSKEGVGQPGSDARALDHQEAYRDADSHI